jgi:SAM-dependent methyltransferase
MGARNSDSMIALTESPNRSNFVGWDVRNWSVALDFWAAHTKQTIANCSALELGSQDGGLSLWLALQGANVVCSDVGPPSENAIRQHQASGVSHLIQYRSINAVEIPYENEFDIVMFKSVLGAVGKGRSDSEEERRARQARAMMQIYRSLKKGGELFFAENLIASPFHQFFRRRFVEWGTLWRYVSLEEMNTFLSAFSRVEYRALGFAGAFGRVEVQRNVLAMLDQAILNHVVPDSWKYIMVGVARK